MLRRLFSSRDRRSSRGAPPGSVNPGCRFYAIGDIHGRLDLLERLLARIDEDHAARGAMPRTLVFLGDLIDRGPKSAQVVERLRLLAEAEPSTRFLLGNHEEVMLKALDGDQAALPFFLRIGGKETVLSYGIDEDSYLRADYPTILELMRQVVPQAHIDFLNGFENIIVEGDYAFVHAGVQPKLPLGEQKPDTLRWIRQGFVDYNGTLEKIIVHGHTISEEVEETPCRIGIDTGAYITGRLTAMGFEGGERWTIQTGQSALLAGAA
jgi:serine/threonine protein phosphatase 1